MPRLRKSVEPLSQLAVNVRKRRKDLGWSQQQLADRTGAHITYVSRIEGDSASPSFDFVVRLAQTLGVQPDDLLKKPVAEMTKAESELNALLEIIHAMRPWSRRQLLKIARNLVDGSDVASITYQESRLPQIKEDQEDYPEEGSEAEQEHRGLKKTPHHP
jgi:transcriptional regulator with XRE-family HTH domain